MAIIKVITPSVTDANITTAKIAGQAIDVSKIESGAVTLVKMANGTDGNIISYDASGNPVAVATGNDGQVLTSAGAGQPPAFETVSAGKILQVVSTTKTDTFTSSSSSFTDITGLTANITPASSSNKVYVNLSVQGSQDVEANRVSYQLIRDNTAISVGASAASRSQASSGLSSPHGDIIASSSVNVLDSPSTTSQITYKVRIANTAGSGNAFVNRTENDENGSGMPRYASTITLMEIAG